MVKPMFLNKSLNKRSIVMVQDNEFPFKKDKSGRDLR